MTQSSTRLLQHSHRPALLAETHIHLAQPFEAEGQLLSAEAHYCAAGSADWRQAVNMYR